MIVAAAALAFRLLFIFWGWTGWRTVTHDPNYMGLSWVYATEGYGICAGYGYAAPETIGDLGALAAIQRITPSTAPRIDPSTLVPEMLHPPGMAILNAAVHFLTGMPVDFPIQFFGAFLDTITACLVYWVAATFLQPKIGFVAGLLYAFYPPQAASVTILRSPEGFLSFFVVGCLVCILQMSRSTGKARIAWCVGAGSLLGVGSYLRPDYLLAPVVVGLALWIFTRQFWRSLVAMIAVQIMALLILLPWAYRNHQLCDRWIFTSTSVGGTLVTGLGQYRNPWGFGGRDEDRAAESRAHGFVSPWSPEADLYFREVFWNSIRSSPSGYLMSVVKRLPMMLISPQSFGYENPNKTQRMGEARKHGRELFDVIKSQPGYVLAAYWDWLLMGIIGFAGLLCSIYMVIRERHQFGLVFLLLSPHLYAIGAHILTHSESRFVLPSMFSFLIGLGYVLSRGWRGNHLTQRPAQLER
jgi:4-amino-4-deoxy-L-arabinose transferase-like glycosyltransferase